MSKTPKDTRISFLHKIFQKTLQNTKIRILYLKRYDKHTYHFTMEVPPPVSRLSYSFFNTVTFNILLIGIFYYMGFLKHFYIFVGEVHIARHTVEKITAFCLVTLPMMWKQ